MMGNGPGATGQLGQAANPQMMDPLQNMNNQGLPRARNAPVQPARTAGSRWQTPRGYARTQMRNAENAQFQPGQVGAALAPGQFQPGQAQAMTKDMRMAGQTPPLSPQQQQQNAFFRQRSQQLGLEQPGMSYLQDFQQVTGPNGQVMNFGRSPGAQAAMRQFMGGQPNAPMGQAGARPQPDMSGFQGGNYAGGAERQAARQAYRADQWKQMAANQPQQLPGGTMRQLPGGGGTPFQAGVNPLSQMQGLPTSGVAGK